MKQLAFLTLLLAPLLAGADWVRMGEDSQQITHYFDPATIGKEGDMRTVRWLEEHRKIPPAACFRPAPCLNSTVSKNAVEPLRSAAILSNGPGAAPWAAVTAPQTGNRSPPTLLQGNFASWSARVSGQQAWPRRRQPSTLQDSSKKLMMGLARPVPSQTLQTTKTPAR